MIALLTPEGILQKAAESLQAEINALLRESKTCDIRSRRPRDTQICDNTVGICILEHAAEILINPEAFSDD